MWREIPWEWLKGQLKKRHEGVRLGAETVKDIHLTFAQFTSSEQTQREEYKQFKRNWTCQMDISGNIFNLE